MKRCVLGIMLLVAIVSLAAMLPAQTSPPPSKSAIQAVAQGDVRIIAQWTVGNRLLAETTLVHVLPLSLFSITPSLPTTMTVGQSLCPIAIGRDSLGGFVTGVAVRWSSSDTTIAKIGPPSTIACPMSDTTVKAPPVATLPPVQTTARKR